MFVSWLIFALAMSAYREELYEIPPNIQFQMFCE